MATVAEPQLAEIDGRSGAPRRGLVRRERLISRLLTETDVPAVLVTPPAGYGKTTILSQWDEADARPFVWLTLDERHNDPALLLGTLVSGLSAIEPVGERVSARARGAPTEHLERRHSAAVPVAPGP
jgi:LuxR family maltose regulon positive regulatory protein